MIYYCLTKDGKLIRTTFDKMSSYNPNVLKFWAVVKHRKTSCWTCLLEALAQGVQTEYADAFAKTHDLHGQNMLEMLGRLKPDKTLKVGLNRYLIEFLKVGDTTKFFTWVAKQKGAGRLLDYYTEQEYDK